MVKRPHIYQLMVRHFGNTNENCKPHGSIEENGCGAFNDINDAALGSLKELGITHVWLTGVLEQASATPYAFRPADDPALLKGKAGSPYAIRDYFDVCPDYASDPEKRLDEFRELLLRLKNHGLKALIDFVPNHVARSYASDIRPELSFGTDDDTSHFFHPNNNFYYLGDLHPGGGAPVKLPTQGESVPYGPESEFGRVTGNNAITWSPTTHDWYETVKLNYGHDFTVGPPRDDVHPLPTADTSLTETPDTWQKMDAILGYWQDMGVDGFRVDMAHMIPMAYWKWQIQRCRQRNESAFFMAEAYDGDPAKMCAGNVLEELLGSGFDAVYDGDSYETLKHTVEGQKWCNDIDQAAGIFSPRFHQSVRYAENHDEVRLASRHHWNGAGMHMGKVVSAILFGMGRGPIMIYNGQEVGERAEGAEGFSGDDGRSSIFDYGALPALVPWVNGHRYDGAQLTPEQWELRHYYAKLLDVCAQPAFVNGDFYGLNHANKENVYYGRSGGENISGHWLYSFLRHDRDSGQTFCIVANTHTNQEFENVRIQIPQDAFEWMRSIFANQQVIAFKDRLGDQCSIEAECGALMERGLEISKLTAQSVAYFEMT